MNLKSWLIVLAIFLFAANIAIIIFRSKRIRKIADWFGEIQNTLGKWL